MNGDGMGEKSDGSASGGGPPREGAIREAGPREVSAWLRAGECVLVDVREADEHARERIAGARPVPLSRFDPRSALVLVARGQKLVIHCKGGRRSADACRMMALVREPGFTVYSMAGGIEAWKREALPVETDRRGWGFSIMRQAQVGVGLGVVIGSMLAWFVDPVWWALPAALGAGLAFAGVTGTCALASLLGRMPWNRTGARGCSSGACQEIKPRA